MFCRRKLHPSHHRRPDGVSLLLRTLTGEGWMCVLLSAGRWACCRQFSDFIAPSAKSAIFSTSRANSFCALRETRRWSASTSTSSSSTSSLTRCAGFRPVGAVQRVEESEARNTRRREFRRVYYLTVNLSIAYA